MMLVTVEGESNSGGSEVTQSPHHGNAVQTCLIKIQQTQLILHVMTMECFLLNTAEEVDVKSIYSNKCNY